MSRPTVSTLSLPAYFFDDHDERELPTPRVLHRTARTVTVAANDPNLAELLNDAGHYAAPDMHWASEYRGLVASARATVRAITGERIISRDAALAAWNANLLRLNKGKIIKPPSVVQCTGSAGWEFGQAEFTLAICLPQHSFTLDGLTRKDMEELSSCVLTLLSCTDAELGSNLLRNKQQPPARAKGKS